MIPLNLWQNYMKKSGFLSDSDKSATAAAQIANKVLILIVFNLSMKARHALINNVNLIFGMPTNGSAMFFERKARGQGRLALLDDKFVDLFFLFVFSLSALSLFGCFLVSDFLKHFTVFFGLVFHGLWFFFGHSLLFLEYSILGLCFIFVVGLTTESFAGIKGVSLTEVQVVVFDALGNPFG